VISLPLKYSAGSDRTEAAGTKQAGNPPQVTQPVDFQEALTAAGQYPICLAGWEEEREVNFPSCAEINQNYPAHPVLDLAIFIGPEGGLTSEVEAIADR